MKVTGISARYQDVDTYSLKGFTAAYKTIGRDCSSSRAGVTASQKSNLIGLSRDEIVAKWSAWMKNLSALSNCGIGYISAVLPVLPT